MKKGSEKRGKNRRTNAERKLESIFVKLAIGLFFIIVVFCLVLLFFKIFNVNLTGKVVSNIDIPNNYHVGEKLDGVIGLTIELGNLINNKTTLSLELIKSSDNSVVLSKQKSFQNFLSGILNPFEIVKESKVCVNVSVDIEILFENCTPQCSDYQSCNDTINLETNLTEHLCETLQNCLDVCVNQTVVDSIENCSLQITREYYFNQVGNYAKNISELIDYTFIEPGDYKLVVTVESLGISAEKDIMVSEAAFVSQSSNQSDETIIGIMQSGTATNASGSVYQCGTITSAGIYTLSTSITSETDCLTISANNTVLDCAGKTISFGVELGMTYSGVVIGTNRNVTIKNCIINGNEAGTDDYGISATSLSDSLIYNNSINVNDMANLWGPQGIYMISASNINISNNIINTVGSSYGGDGIRIGVGDQEIIGSIGNSYFSNNNITSGTWDIFLGTSSSNTFYNNTFNSIQFYSTSTSDTLKKNTLTSFGIGGDSAGTCGEADLNCYATNMKFTDQIIPNYVIYQLSTIIFENTTSGKIDFYLGGAGTGITGTGTDMFGSVESYAVSISNNSAFVNSGVVTTFNAGANVSLNNIAIANGIILQGGVACDEFTCSGLTNVSNGDGTYNYSFSVMGWSNYSIGEGGSSDTTAPSVYVNYPLNTSYRINVSSINYTASDSIGLSRCWHSNNSGIWNSTSVSAGTNWTDAISVQGSNTWTVYCNDTTGNVNSSSVVFFKDSIAPVINLTSPISGTTYSGSTYNINFTFNVTDNSAIANCTAYVSGTAYSNISSITKSALNGINATLAAATYSAYVNCTDLLGNTGNSSNIIFTITIPPATTPATTSSGGGSVVFWKSTLDVTGSNIVNMDLGYFKELGVQERVKISFGIDAGGNEETHYIGAVSIASDSQSAVIQIMSDPMNVTFKIGEEKKFDLNNDMFYDLYVKLNSIINKKANVTIRKINEPMVGSAVDGNEDKNGIPLVEVNHNQSQTEKPSVSIVDNWRMYLIIVIFALSIFSIIFHLIKVRKKEKEIGKLRKRG